MTVVEGLTIFALIAGPIASVYIGLYLQKSEARLQRRRDVFTNLVGNRYDPLTADRLKGLALIEIAFADEPKVLFAWRAWHESVSNAALNDPPGLEQRNLKYYDLLTAMARAIGLSNITRNELERSYLPESLALLARMRVDSEIEWNRILKHSENFGIKREPPQRPEPGARIP